MKKYKFIGKEWGEFKKDQIYDSSYTDMCGLRVGYLATAELHSDDWEEVTDEIV